MARRTSSYGRSTFLSMACIGLPAGIANIAFYLQQPQDSHLAWAAFQLSAIVIASVVKLRHASLLRHARKLHDTVFPGCTLFPGCLESSPLTQIVRPGEVRGASQPPRNPGNS